MNLSKRDFISFLLGALFTLVAVLAYDWNEFTRGLSGEVSAREEMKK